MKKFFSLVLALVMALSLTTVAWGADADTDVAKIGDTGYATLADAFKAVQSDDTVTLLQDVTISDTWDCRSNGAKFTVPVTIDGNGKTLKLTGTVKDNNWNTVFRFEGETATVKNLTIDVSEATGVQRGISSKGSIVVETCTFIGNDSAKRAIIFGEGAGSAIGNVTATVTGSTFTNWSYGVSDNQSGKDAKAVSVTGNTFNDASVLVSAAEDVTFTGNTVDDGYVNISSYSVPNELAVTATGNTLDANLADYNRIRAEAIDAQGDFLVPVAEVGGKYYLTIQDANDEASDGDTVVILPAALDSDETFDMKAGVAYVLPAGYTYVNGAIVNNAGQFVGSSSALTSSKATYGATLAAALANKTETVEVKAALSPSTSLKTFQTYQVFVTELADKTVSVLPNQYIVVPTDVNADVVVVDGSKIIFLAQVAGVTKYDDNAEAVKVAYNAKPACDDVYVASAADAGVYYLYKNAYYVECDAVSADKVFNVDGVAVAAKATNLVKTLAHTYAFDTKTVGTKTEVTKVYCTVCKDSFSFVVGDLADAVKAFGAGNYADTGLNDANGDDIFVRTASGLVYVPVTPSTDKVTSAETFDAGIAMYVGMSVMAAAGSAVVIGKKKD